MAAHLPIAMDFGSFTMVGGIPPPLFHVIPPCSVLFITGHHDVSDVNSFPLQQFLSGFFNSAADDVERRVAYVQRLVVTVCLKVPMTDVDRNILYIEF